MTAKEAHRPDAYERAVPTVGGNTSMAMSAPARRPPPIGAVTLLSRVTRVALCGGVAVPVESFPIDGPPSKPYRARPAPRPVNKEIRSKKWSEQVAE